MHRGELTPEEATDFLVEHTAFETPNARAEVRRYTYTPGYQLSYLLGKVLILGLREEERRRRGAGFRSRRSTTRCCATARCRSASTGGCSRDEGLTRWTSSRRSTSRRAARGSCTGPARPPASGRPPTGRSGSPSSSSPRAPGSSTWSTSTARSSARAGEPRGAWAPSRRGSRCRSRSPAGSRRPTTSGSRSPRARRGSCCPVAIIERPEALARCLAVAGDWLAVGLDPRPERIAAFPWRRPTPPTLDALVEELVARGVAPARPDATAARRPTPRCSTPSSAATTPTSSSRAASPTSTASAACATPASPASSSERRSSPVPSTSHGPWRPPHDQSTADPSHAASPCRRSRCPARRGLLAAACATTGAAATGEPSAAAPTAVASAVAGAPADCPTSQPEPLPAGEKRIVTIATDKGDIEIELDGVLSPIAVGNFVALAECGWYDGVVFHRVVPGLRHPGRRRPVRPLAGRRPAPRRHRWPAVHDPGRAGHRDVRPRHRRDGPHRRAELASARSSSSSLDDARRAAPGSSYNTYQIIGDGDVRHGGRRRDRRGRADAEIPTTPVVMTDVSVATPSAPPPKEAAHDPRNHHHRSRRHRGRPVHRRRAEGRRQLRRSSPRRASTTTSSSIASSRAS